jgi:cell wall-associated NlpC family hydrolase
MTITYAVAIGIADVRRDPDPTSELVTQALMNVPAIADETSGEWTHVTLPDYTGWIRTDELAEPIIKGFTRVSEHCATPLDLVAVVATTHTTLYSEPEGEASAGTVYLSTILPLLDTTQPTRLQVALPGEATAWVEREAVSMQRANEPYPQQPIDTITNYARSFLNVPYLWGGTSWAGVDCSGFVQLCYRIGGWIIPRDADQQHDALTQAVPRKEMQKGDLIFFGSKAITHVGMALSQQEYIHAEGQEFNRVIIHSFDPANPHYNKRLDDIVRAIKRVVS